MGKVTEIEDPMDKGEFQGVPDFFRAARLLYEATIVKEEAATLNDMKSKLDKLTEEAKRLVDKLYDDDMPTCEILKKLNAVWEAFNQLYSEYKRRAEAFRQAYRRMEIYAMLGEPEKVKTVFIGRMISPSEVRLTREKLKAKIAALQADAEALSRTLAESQTELRADLISSAEWLSVQKAVASFISDTTDLVKNLKDGKITREQFTARLNELFWETAYRIVDTLRTWRQRRSQLWEKYEKAKSQLQETLSKLTYLTIDCPEKQAIRQAGGVIEP